MPTTDLAKPQQTFCGVPFLDDLSEQSADIVILGAPHGSPYEPGTPSHATNAPSRIREALAWYSSGRDQLDMDIERPVMGEAEVCDCGDIKGDLHDGSANRGRIRQVTETILTAGGIPILLGGDDSTPIPFIDAYGTNDRPIAIVQVDAHIDWRDEVGGERYGFSSTMRRASEMKHVRHIIQVGARGPGSARESDYRDATAWGVKFITARRLHTDGIAAVIEAVPARSDVLLTIDVDGLDPSLVPGVILPAFGGLLYQDVLDLIYGISRRAKIVGATFVEYVPERDPSGIGAKAIARIASCLIGMI